MNSAWAALSDMFVMMHRRCHGRADLTNRSRLRCKKFKAGSREYVRIALRPNEQRDNSTDLYASGREYYGAIDLAVRPDVPVAEPPSKVARPVPSAAAEENPTSADWPP